MHQQIDCGGKLLDLARPRVMGILNVTPDSFSDGGHFFDPQRAIAHAKAMVSEGAAIIDVGGESTRPGAEPVSVAEELRRVIPVIEALYGEIPVPVSIDTSKPEVMREAAAAGAGMINDVRALQEPGALAAAAETGLPVCLMHMQGQPRTMQTRPQYENVVEDILSFFAERLQAALQAGIEKEDILLDPGFGFGKTLAHNYVLLRELERFGVLGCPLLVGMSRKSMIAGVLDLPAEERMVPSVALALLAAQRGANIMRVHDVRETVQALAMLEAMMTMETENQ